MNKAYVPFLETLDQQKTKIKKKNFDASTRLASTDISMRPYNALTDEELDTLGKVAECSARELLRIPNFGVVSLKEVEALLASAGLSLRDHNTEKPSPPPLPPPAPPYTPTYINRWFFVPFDHPNPGQSVLFYCANGEAFIGIYVKGLGWCVAQPKNTGHDWGTLIRVTVDVVRWLPMPDPDYDQEFA